VRALSHVCACIVYIGAYTLTTAALNEWVFRATPKPKHKNQQCAHPHSYQHIRGFKNTYKKKTLSTHSLL